MVARDLSIATMLAREVIGLPVVSPDPPEAGDGHAVDGSQVAACLHEHPAYVSLVATMSNVLSRDLGRHHDRAPQHYVAGIDVYDLGDLDASLAQEFMYTRLGGKARPLLGQHARVTDLPGALHLVDSRRDALLDAFDRGVRRAGEDARDEIFDRG